MNYGLYHDMTATLFRGRCRSIECYEKVRKIEEGTYGVVFEAKDRETGERVALKRLKLEGEREGFPVTSLREINSLMQISHHPNIVRLREVVMGGSSTHPSVYIVMDYVEYDMRYWLDEYHHFDESECKTFLHQLLAAVAALHERWFIHRDLKPGNLLVGRDGQLRVADFGLSRRVGSPPMGSALTRVVVTLWYRAPEVLLGAPDYGWPVDMWSVGCIMGELLLGTPLFAGRTEVEMLGKIFESLGQPSEVTWPGWQELPHANKLRLSPTTAQPTRPLRYQFEGKLSPTGLDLMSKMLTLDPGQRISAAEALVHPFFRESPSPRDPATLHAWRMLDLTGKR